MKSNFTLKRSFALLGIVLAILSALTFATVQMMHDTKTDLQEAADVRYRSYQLAQELKQSSQNLTSAVRSYVATGDARHEARYNDIVAVVTGKKPRANGVSISMMELMRQAGFTEQELAKLSQAQVLSLTLVKTEEKAMAAVKGLFEDGNGGYTRRGDPDMVLAVKLVNDRAYDNAVTEIMKPVGEFVAMMDARTSGKMSEAREASTRSYVMCIVMLALTLALSVGGLYLLFALIRNQLDRGLKAAQLLGTGDLRVKIKVEQDDEIGRLMGAINGIGQGLAQVVTTVRSGTETINVAAGEIATGNMDLSNRTESQATSLEETAGSMEKLTTTVQQNTANAREANQLANSASELANRGGTVVGNVVQTMESIKASSGKIADIISVIDGIAFQTNILALNAAVEAARAGEQGRGFAVVASEVRSLAQRSASAAKEIKELIVDSVEKVDAGGKLVDEAGVTMGELVSSVRHVAEIMREITMASEAQSTGIASVNDAIVQMEAITQQNAALVEQAAAAAGSLREQSDGLMKDVSIFKLSDEHGGGVKSVVKPAASAVRSVPKAPPRRATPKAAPQLESRPKPVPEKKPAAATAADGGEWAEF